jgi:hypothetical protein
MKEFIHLPVPGVKAHKYIKRAEIQEVNVHFGAEEEAIYILMNTGKIHTVHAKYGVTMADLDAIVMDITGQ